MITTLKATIGSIGIAMLLMVGALAPAIASAHNDTSSVNSVHGVSVAITEGGKVLVRGAKVMSVSGSTITAQTTFGSASLSWTVNTNTSTVFSDSQNDSTTLGQISIGDTISFAGMAVGTNIFTVDASAVKDWTKAVKPVTVSGTISTINTSLTSVTLAKHGNSGKTYTVNFTSTTSVTLNGASSSFANLSVNDGIKVTGALSSDGKVLTATSVVATRPAAVESDKKFDKLLKLWLSKKSFLHWDD